MPGKTQKEQVLDHLRSGQSLTSMDAVRLFNITRLAARIYELRQDGHPIQDETIVKKSADGKTQNFSRYYLDAGDGAASEPSADEEPEQQASFGDLAVGAHFELDGREWEKHGAFRAMSSSGPGGGFREVAPGQTVTITD